jgi:hypothetical protein
MGKDSERNPAVELRRKQRSLAAVKNALLRWVAL